LPRFYEGVNSGHTFYVKKLVEAALDLEEGNIDLVKKLVLEYVKENW
jgi:hypothetical protein